jgi:hypothetical protein
MLRIELDLFMSFSIRVFGRVGSQREVKNGKANENNKKEDQTQLGILIAYLGF